LTRFFLKKAKIQSFPNQASNNPNNKAFSPYKANPATGYSTVAMEIVRGIKGNLEGKIRLLKQGL
jgi:hypothetical protein